ncbi:hypothetical protein GF357_00570 [Candidatus Dojkabacteria bacterium]|nr:hypothetical protein [Candidatus Dojkabacteria bacterium]
MKTFVIQLLFCSGIFALIKIIRERFPNIFKYIKILTGIWLIVLDLLGILTVVSPIYPNELYHSVIQLIYTSTISLVFAVFWKSIVATIQSKANREPNLGLTRQIRITEKLSISKATLILLLAILLSFIVKLIKIDKIAPLTDEMYHLATAKQYLNGNHGNVWYGSTYPDIYYRAMFVTQITKFFLSFSNNSIGWARVSGILVSLFSGVAIYKSIHKHNKSWAILAASMWLFSPWGIVTSRIIREYSYYALIFQLLVIWYSSSLERTLTKRNLDTSTVIKNIGPTMIALTTFLIYAIYVDPLSTAKLVFIPYTALLAYTFFRYLKWKGITISIKIQLLIGLLFWGCIIISDQLALWQIPVLENTRLELENNVYLFPTFSETFYKWLIFILSDKMLMSPILIFTSTLIGFFVIFAEAKKKKQYINICISYVSIAFLYFTLFHFKRSFHPKYFYYALPWLIIVQARGIIFIATQLVSKIHRKAVARIIYVGILLFSINWYSVYLAVIPNISGPNRANTREFHEDIGYTIEKYAGEIDNTRIFTTLPFFFYWYMDPNESSTNIYYYDYDIPTGLTDPQCANLPIGYSRFLETMENGWLFIDKRRNNWGIFLKEDDFTCGNFQIRLIENNERYLVYRWNNEE